MGNQALAHLCVLIQTVCFVLKCNKQIKFMKDKYQNDSFPKGNK